MLRSRRHITNITARLRSLCARLRCAHLRCTCRRSSSRHSSLARCDGTSDVGRHACLYLAAVTSTSHQHNVKRTRCHREQVAIGHLAIGGIVPIAHAQRAARQTVVVEQTQHLVAVWLAVRPHVAFSFAAIFPCTSCRKVEREVVAGDTYRHTAQRQLNQYLEVRQIVNPHGTSLKS